MVELTSLNFEKRAQFFVNSVPAQPQKDWADYLRGAAWALGERYPLSVGLSGVIEGSPPHRRAVLLRGGHHYLPYGSVPGQWDYAGAQRS